MNKQAATDNRKNDIYNRDIEQMFISNVDKDEGEKVKILEQLSARIQDKTAQIQDEFNKTSDSTIKRTAKQITDNIGISDDAIKKRNIKLPGSKKDDENN